MHKDVARRIMALVLSVCMIAGMVDLSGFTVRAAGGSLSGGTVTLAGTTFDFTGEEIKPAVTAVTDFYGDPVDAANYTVGYQNNINAGVATVTVTGTNGYQDSITETFRIEAKDISSCSITAIGEQMLQQEGVAVTPTVEVIDPARNNLALNGIMSDSNVSGKDFTYAFTDNTTAGTATVTVTGRNNYKGTKSTTFTITKLDEAKLDFQFRSGTRYPYQSGNEIQPEITNVTYDGTPLTEDQYEVRYRNNRYATTGAAEVYIVGRGRYTGLTSASKTFSIIKNVGDGKYSASLNIVVDPIADQSYAGGTPVTITADQLTVRDPDYQGKSLAAGVDYQIKADSFSNNIDESTDASVASFWIEGLGAYTGTREVTFKIVAAKLSSAMVTIDDSACKYDGTNNQYDKLNITVQNGQVVYQKGVDYTVEPVDSGVSAGTHQVKITPMGKLKGSAIVMNYSVAKRPLSDAKVSAYLIDYTDTTYTYSNSAKTPKMEMTYEQGDGSTYTLVQGQDYEVGLKYTNNINATKAESPAYVWAVGMGNFEGESMKLPFVINPIKLTETNTEITGIVDGQTYTFTGKAITPSVNVRVTGMGNLTKDQDYTVEYLNNTNKGRATVKITGIGNYKGEFTKYFDITQRAIDDGVSISLASSAQYTGKQIRPEVSLNYNGVALTADVDYTLDYGENINVGSGSITITGKGNYTSMVTKSFRIAPRTIGSLIKVTDEEKGYDFINGTTDARYYKYTGALIEPNLTVIYDNPTEGMNNYALVAGTDYDITFSKNQDIGTAQAVIVAKGNYTGSKTLNFSIKGDLSDYNSSPGYTSVTIPVQVYTSKEIIPSNETVAFNGKTLTKGRDYNITCTNNVSAGRATAQIEGIGNYFGTATDVEFTIRPLDLTNDSLTANGYVINGVSDAYIYSGLPINPVPSITHNGTALTEGNDYYIDYNAEDVDNVNVGTGKLVVNGSSINYTGSHDVEYDIEPYDIGASYAENYVEILDVQTAVVLDEVKAGNVSGVEMDPLNPDAVIQPNLKVKYTPVNLNGTPDTSNTRELDPATEYDVSYSNNTSIGTATITITGKGNFTGTITKEFKIRGDLAAESTTMEVEDWVYTPADTDGISTNTPEPVVTYTITYNSGRKEKLTLVKDVDYKVSYVDNENATLDGTPAKVVISPVVTEGGTMTGYYVGTRQAEFEILQRDLSKAIEAEGVEKDPLLDVTGLIDDGYEYTGSPIIPELEVTCNGMPLSWQIAGNAGGSLYDYEISAVNNTNVYEYAVGAEGERGERLTPVLTVSARKDANGNYVGNYKGEFQMEFKLNPREISQDTIDTLVNVAGIAEEMDYTGEEITFPMNPNDPADTRNAIDVTWSKNYEDGTKVRDLLTEGTDYTISYQDNIKIGVATVTISAVEEGNYIGSYDKNFKIMASIAVVDEEDPAKRYIELDYDHDVQFGIVDVYPQMEFLDYSGVLCGDSEEPKLLEEGVDFEIVTESNQGSAPEASRNNKNVAREDADDVDVRPTVIIRGIGCYRGVISRYYNIVPKDLAADEGDITAVFKGSLNSENYQNAFIYTGNPIEPEISVYNHGELMTPDVDYTVAGFVNNTDITTDTVKAGVIIQAVDGGNYLNQKTLYFSIIPRPVDTMQITITNGAQIYDRTEKKPEVEVSYMDGNDKIVLTKNDYDIAYENNIDAAKENIGEKAPRIIITGKGSYGGTAKKTFTIEPESMEETNTDFEIKAASANYTGKPVTTTLEVKTKDGTVLVEGKDYQLGAYTDNVQAGTGYVTLQGMGNYTGSRQVAFNILPMAAAEDFEIEEIPVQTYSSKPLTPEVTVTLGGENIKLTEGIDYEVTYSNNINVGTATVTVVGAGNYTGKKTASFVIDKKSLGTAEGADEDMVLEETVDQLYTGRGVTPDVELSFQREEEQINSTLVLNRDYKLSYTSNVAVGTATVIITGINNYTGSMQSTFRILGGMNLATVASIPVQQYTGNPVTPKPKISFAGKELKENTDYTLEYDNNVERGTATITITGMGWYTGTKTVTFDIAREFSAATVIKGVAAAYTFTGTAIKPPVRVEDNGNVLTNGTDYQVSYSKNVDVGTATITVTGINRYRGSRSTTFKITPQMLGRAEVAQIADQTYNGKKQQPAVKVVSGGVSLAAGKDYTTVYVNSTKPGKASVIIKGKGNFTGTKTVNYNIVIPKVTGVAVSKCTDTSITFSWKKNSAVSGYEVYNAKNKRVARVTKASATSVAVTKLKAATVDTFRIRAFVTKNGQYYYSDFVKIKASTAPKATVIMSLTSSKSKQAVLKWKKIKGTTRYDIYRSTSEKGKYKKIASTTSTSYTDKKLVGGKTYYYKVRVCKKNKIGTYYSSYSPVKSVTAKK